MSSHSKRSKRRTARAVRDRSAVRARTGPPNAWLPPLNSYRTCILTITRASVLFVDAMSATGHRRQNYDREAQGSHSRVPHVHVCGDMRTDASAGTGSSPVPRRPLASALDLDDDNVGRRRGAPNRSWYVWRRRTASWHWFDAFCAKMRFSFRALGCYCRERCSVLDLNDATPPGRDGLNFCLCHAVGPAEACVYSVRKYALIECNSACSHARSYARANRGNKREIYSVPCGARRYSSSSRFSRF